MKEPENTKEYLFKWTIIDNLGKMRLSKSSYYWVILLPVVVSLLPPMPNGEFKFLVFEEQIVLNYKLPFKWYLLYLVGLFFGLATLTYEVFCPPIIKTFKRYSEFKAAGYPHHYLIEQAWSYKCLEYKPIKDYDYTEPTSVRDRQTNAAMTNVSYVRGNRETPYSELVPQYEKYRQEAFDLIFTLANKHYPIVRFICPAFYIVGILILVWIFGENAFYVFKHFIFK